MAEGGIPLSEWSGSGATDRLNQTISDYQKTAAEQTRTLIRLTWALVGLTVVLAVGLIVQIILAIAN